MLIWIAGSLLDSKMTISYFLVISWMAPGIHLLQYKIYTNEIHATPDLNGLIDMPCTKFE